MSRPLGIEIQARALIAVGGLFATVLAVARGQALHPLMPVPQSSLTVSGLHSSIGNGLVLTVLVEDVKTGRTWTANGKRTHKSRVDQGRFHGNANREFSIQVDGFRYRQFYKMESYPSETVRFAEIPMLENSGLSDEINENENNRTYSTLVTGMARTAPTVRFADLYFGYSQGPWQARCVYKAQATKSHYVLTDSEPTAEIRYGQFRVTIPKRLLDMTEREAFRFVGYDKDGKLWNSYGDGCSTLGLFTSGRNLSRIELQTRPYTWVKIPRLSLQPPR